MRAGCDEQQRVDDAPLSEGQAAVVAKAQALDTLAQLCLQQCRALRDHDRDASRCAMPTSRTTSRAAGRTV